jgi:predicted transcriptional regulator
MASKWYTLPDYPRYEVNTKGQVRNKVHKKIRKPAINMYTGQPFMSFHTGGGGNKTVNLTRLVCKAFHGEPPTPKHFAGHLDGDKANLAKSNLKWLTPTESKLRDVAAGRRKPKGNALKRLTEAEYNEVFDLYEQGLSMKQVSKRLGVSCASVSRILKGVFDPHGLGRGPVEIRDFNDSKRKETDQALLDFLKANHRAKYSEMCGARTMNARRIHRLVAEGRLKREPAEDWRSNVWTVVK